MSAVQRVDQRVPQCESDAVRLGGEESGRDAEPAISRSRTRRVCRQRRSRRSWRKTLSGLTPSDIESVSPEIVEQIFCQNISMGKGIGLMGMVNAVRALALYAHGVEQKPVNPLACPE